MNDKTRRKNSGKCSKKTPKQQQTPENLPQMFQKNTKTATNAGKSPANVPKKGQNSNIFRRKNSGKCSKSLNRHFLYIAVQKITESRQKTTVPIQPCKETVGTISGKCSKKTAKTLARVTRSLLSLHGKSTGLSV